MWRLDLQKICGIILIVISLIAIAIAVFSTEVADKDCTAVLLTLPFGIYLFFTKTRVIR